MKVKKREPLEKEFDYYIANQGKLVKKFKENYTQTFHSPRVIFK
jgi:hypothetical protein